MFSCEYCEIFENGSFHGTFLVAVSADVKLHNMKFVTSLCIYFALHNMGIAMNDQCKPRWRSNVKKLQLNNFIFDRQENKQESPVVSKQIPDWIREHVE